MAVFVFGLLFFVVGIALAALPLSTVPERRLLSRFVGSLLVVLSLIMIATSTAIFVGDDQGGIVVRKFGSDMPPNRIVATNGEKGPQARVLGPGWHFGYWPWLYDLQQVPNAVIEPGQVGLVSAFDGKSLPVGEVYAPEWSSPEDMLDGEKFLADGRGYRGPQLTVLTPGRYRYNPRLFVISQKPIANIAVGEVGVVKASAGPIYKPATGETVETINGIPLVPKGYRGIWNEPLLPNSYYLHPDAYTLTKVQTTNRIYTYQDKHWAIRVRSKDGFTFPVDVRVSGIISAADAPYLVALLANPDRVSKDDQEDEELSVLEAKIILPLIRTIFRDVAQEMNALQFINSRTQVEQTAGERMSQELAKFKVKSEGIFIGNIELDETAQGKQLLATQTDREVAINEQKTFAEKKSAEEARAKYILAQEEAEQQRKLAQAKYQVLVREQEAKAREVEASGEARYIEITFEARKKGYEEIAQAIGPQGVTMLEIFKLVADGKIQITPQVMVSGGAGGTLEALAGTILGRSLSTEVEPAKSGKTK